MVLSPVPVPVKESFAYSTLAIFRLFFERGTTTGCSGGSSVPLRLSSLRLKAVVLVPCDASLGPDSFFRQSHVLRNVQSKEPPVQNMRASCAFPHRGS
jgi:hypothetical protein